jgi:hypothetical protein
VTKERGSGYQVNVGIAHQAGGHRVPETVPRLSIFAQSMLLVRRTHLVRTQSPENTPKDQVLPTLTSKFTVAKWCSLTFSIFYGKIEGGVRRRGTGQWFVGYVLTGSVVRKEGEPP